MSKEFGPDWKSYESDRMAYFIEIMRLEAEEQNKKNHRAETKNNFRKRM